MRSNPLKRVGNEGDRGWIGTSPGKRSEIPDYDGVAVTLESTRTLWHR